MADRIIMDTEQLERWADKLGQVSNALSQAEAALRRVDTSDGWWRKVNMSRSIYLKDAGRNVSINGARDAVSELTSAIDLYQSRTKQLQNALDKNAGVFADAESEVLGIAQGAQKGADSDVYNVAKSLSGAFASILKYHGDPSSWSKPMRADFESLLNRFDEYFVNEDGDYVFSGEGIGVIIGADGFLKSVHEHGFKKLKAFSSNREYFEGGGYAEDKVELGFDLLKGKEKLYKKDFNKWKDSEVKEGDSPDRVMELFTVGLGFSEKVAVKHAEGAGKYGIAEGSYSADVGFAEAHGEISGGFYVTKVGPDGKEYYTFEPGVHAEIGASVGLVQAKADGRLGNEYFAFVGEVEAEALTAEAQVEANLGMVDGKFAANVSASAEATLVEASGKVGVDVMGVEGTVGGSVSVGVGAHADVGYHDGKISFDIGASLGVGVSVNAEIDVSGAVDAVTSAVEDIADAADEFVDAAQEKCEAFFDWLTPW